MVFAVVGAGLVCAADGTVVFCAVVGAGLVVCSAVEVDPACVDVGGGLGCEADGTVVVCDAAAGVGLVVSAEVDLVCTGTGPGLGCVVAGAVFCAVVGAGFVCPAVEFVLVCTGVGAVLVGIEFCRAEGFAVEAVFGWVSGTFFFNSSCIFFTEAGTGGLEKSGGGGGGAGMWEGLSLALCTEGFVFGTLGVLLNTLAIFLKIFLKNSLIVFHFLFSPRLRLLTYSGIRSLFRLKHPCIILPITALRGFVFFCSERDCPRLNSKFIQLIFIVISFVKSLMT
jgi:hypothetical protein